MKLSLHIGAIKVVSVEIVVGPSEGREFKLIPEVGTVICEVVDVETWVYEEQRAVDVVVEITTRLASIWSCRNRSAWRELVRILVEEISKATFVRTGCDVCQIAFVHVEDIVVFEESWDNGCCTSCQLSLLAETFRVLTINHCAVIIDGRVIDLHPLDVEVMVILSIQHPTSNIWDILASITLSQDVYLVAFHRERVDEVLPETHELLRHIFLIRNILGPAAEACSDGLVNPNHVGEICP